MPPSDHESPATYDYKVETGKFIRKGQLLSASLVTTTNALNQFTVKFQDITGKWVDISANFTSTNFSISSSGSTVQFPITPTERIPVRQDEDDQAFMSYFDFESQTGFAWNGSSNTVEVMEGGLGERVTDTFDMLEAASEVGLHNSHSFTVSNHADYFKQVCKAYLKNRNREMPVVDADFK